MEQDCSLKVRSMVTAQSPCRGLALWLCSHQGQLGTVEREQGEPGAPASPAGEGSLSGLIWKFQPDWGINFI